MSIFCIPYSVHSSTIHSSQTIMPIFIKQLEQVKCSVPQNFSFSCNTWEKLMVIARNNIADENLCAVIQ